MLYNLLILLVIYQLIGGTKTAILIQTTLIEFMASLIYFEEYMKEKYLNLLKDIFLFLAIF